MDVVWSQHIGSWQMPRWMTTGEGFLTINMDGGLVKYCEMENYIELLFIRC